MTLEVYYLSHYTLLVVRPNTALDRFKDAVFFP
jgi:hypothetical protein